MPVKQRAFLISLLLTLFTLVLYWPATHFDFINYDDPEYILHNPAVQQGVNAQTIFWALKTNHASNWHPLTWTSHMADFARYGRNAGGHHLTSILFHCANAVLLFLVLTLYTGAAWRSALAAALFAWHPLHVESVAWISERKDVLCGFFWLLTLLSYGFYVNCTKDEKLRRTGYYLLTLLCFLLGLMAKPMMVTLPFVLLLLDAWPLRRKFSWNLLVEKLPFMAAAVAVCLITLWAQKAGNSVVSLHSLSIASRLADAICGCGFYLQKLVWPSGLALAYPYPFTWNLLKVGVSAVVLLTMTVAGWRLRKKQPWILIGWMWFLITLLPVIGLAQVGQSPWADRYSYLPSIGIFIGVIWSLPESLTKWPRPGFVSALVAGALLFLLGTAAATQLAYWQNSATLFRRTLAVTTNNVLAEYNYAAALVQQGHATAAIEHYQRAISLPLSPMQQQFSPKLEAHYNLGLIYRSQREWPECAAQFQACAEESPHLARAHSNLGIALAGWGKTNEALIQFQITAQLRPGAATTPEIALANALVEAGHLDEARLIVQREATKGIVQNRPDEATQAAVWLEQHPTTRH